MKKSPVTTIVNRLTRAGYSDRFARMWAAVAYHETGAFKSELFQKANNPWGMKVPRIRQSTRNGEYKIGQTVYSRYSSVSKAVDDLLFYLAALKYPKDFQTVADLTSFMKNKGYFEDSLSNYTRGVQNGFEKLFPNYFLAGGGKFQGAGGSGSW